MIQYNDFAVTIGNHTTKGYEIKAEERLLTGAINRITRSPEYFRGEDLLRRLPQINQTIPLAVRQTRVEGEIIRAFGRDLFDALFVGSIRNGFYYALNVVRAAPNLLGLRVRLRLPSELQVLPWELMFLSGNEEDEDGEPADFLCLKGAVTLVRSRHNLVPAAVQPINLPLRILVVAASPFDYSPIEARKEIGHLLSSLSTLICEGKVKIDFIHGADTVVKVRQKINQNGAYHILHFIGHGEKNGEQLLLVLEDFDRRPQRMTPLQIFQMLVQVGLPRLVFLNVCEGAKALVGAPIISIAGGFLRAGVPAVIAHQFEISYPAAEILTRHLYQGLSGGLPVDESLAQARHGVGLHMPSPIESFTPVLFLNNESGHLFTINLGGEGKLSPDVGYFVRQAREAAKARPPRWSESADYAQESLVIQSNHIEAQSLRELSLAEEGLAVCLQKAAFEEQLSRAEGVDFEEQVESLEKSIEWYEKYENDYLKLGRPQDELSHVTQSKQGLQARITQLKELEQLKRQVAQLTRGVRDAWLQWKG